MRKQTCGNSGYPAINSQAGTNLKTSGRQFFPDSTHKVVVKTYFERLSNMFILTIMNLPAGKIFLQNLPTKIRTSVNNCMQAGYFLSNPPTKIKNLSYELTAGRSFFILQNLSAKSRISAHR